LNTFEVRWPGLLVWLTTWVLLWVSNDVLNLGNLALLLVLGSALGGMWLSAGVSLVSSFLSVLAFNWLFVPPRYTFNVSLHQDLLLLVSLLGVSVMVSFLMARLRTVAESESQQAMASEKLRNLSEEFREVNGLPEQGELLQKALQEQVQTQVAVLLLPEVSSTQPHQQAFIIGQPNDQDTQGLWACVNQSVVLGPGSGRFENQPTLFLPLRGRVRALGAVAIHNHPQNSINDSVLRTLQQMCDLLGVNIERKHNLQTAQQAKEEALHQNLRNTLLTSISHDYRTPLANLMGAASAIHNQCDRLQTEQIKKLADTVLIEAQHLNRMTSNTLQLARLDAAPTHIHKDWESLQEIMGSVLTKTRLRYPLRKLEVDIPPSLPLIMCDAMLLVQLFDNLVENAIKYSPDDGLIFVRTVSHEEHIEIQVTDHGTGVPDDWKDKVFKPFVRLHKESMPADASDQAQLRRGVGVGLAVCLAIAKVHDAHIWIQDAKPHGTTVCVSFSVQTQPTMLAGMNES
jgi:two-component system sensor histidine kinase KdpD